MHIPADQTFVEGHGDTVLGQAHVDCFERHRAQDGTAVKGWKWDSQLEKFVRTQVWSPELVVCSVSGGAPRVPYARGQLRE